MTCLKYLIGVDLTLVCVTKNFKPVLFFFSSAEKAIVGILTHLFCFKKLSER